ncbi:MAG: archaellin/type IV pilin N-terminal domain-containing protein, partial [Nitrososphaerales archaeon]
MKRVRFGSKRGRKAIAEIIAALLLILIAVAAGAVVYTYILNF